MPQTFRARRLRRERFLSIVSLAVLLLMLAPYGASFVTSARAENPVPPPAGGTAFSNHVFWNGIDTNTAPTAASPISWTFSQVATVVFNWTGPAGGAGISQAFLVVVFFGAPAYTKQQVESQAVPTAGGMISMTYDLTQFKWLLQGLYPIHAYLEDPSGNTVWSETFYVKVMQSYDLVVATVALLLITVIELYMVATVGPRAADKIRGKQQAGLEAMEEPALSSPTPSEPSGPSAGEGPAEAPVTPPETS